MASSPGNRHCASCIGTLSFPIFGAHREVFCSRSFGASARIRPPPPGLAASLAVGAGESGGRPGRLLRVHRVAGREGSPPGRDRNKAEIGSECSVAYIRNLL